jgi:DUF2891 family protein
MRSSSDSRVARGPVLDQRMASRFAKIALGHVGCEYPNRLDHVLTGPADVKSPRELHPVFFGSFDWHSCVHSYWLLATLYRLYPSLPQAGAIRTLFADSFVKQKITAERAYLKRPSAQIFERPYGWAWLLALQAELLRHDHGDADCWCSALQPLAADFAERFRDYLRKAAYPIRAGTHGNTAFALVLAREYAEAARDRALAESIRATAKRWYAKDFGCQAWEPDGEDFLSPSLTEAHCMALVLSPARFRAWLAGFLPRLAEGEPETLFVPAKVSDRTDGRIVHLDGLNLSRAWSWRSIAAVLQEGDPIRHIAEKAVHRHLSASLPFIARDYAGEHWLASFALLALRAWT